MLRVARRAPVFGIPLRPAGLAALYDVAEDWVPIYDKSDLPGFFVACGTSGNQFKNAPLAGKFMAAIIDAEAAGRDHDVDPVGFVGPRTGRTIDLAAFSRRRDPTASSGTVMKINSLIAANVDGTNAIDTTVSLYSNGAQTQGNAPSGGTAYPIASTISVPADASLIIIDKTTGYYLMEGQSITVTSGTASKITYAISYELIS